MTTISKFAFATAVLLAFSPALSMAKETDHSHDRGVSQGERGDGGRDSRDKVDTGKDSKDNGSRDNGNRDHGNK